MIENQLKIALIQTDLVWERPIENRRNLANKIENIQDAVDVVILPEMFTTGFTMNADKVSENMNGETVSWMKRLAEEKNTSIMGSLVISENDQFYNRLVFVEPNGKIQHYDKRHTFTLAGEDKVYSAGKEKLIINFKGWKICPLICYDLRFPVWSRNTANYDVLVYVANWPKPRIDAWDALLKARAIENMAYCIGVNRVGKDGLDIEYVGHSAIYDVLGNKMSDLHNVEEAIEIVTLEKRHIESYRNKLKFLEDRDEFIIN